MQIWYLSLQILKHWLIENPRSIRRQPTKQPANVGEGLHYISPGKLNANPSAPESVKRPAWVARIRFGDPPTQ